MQGGWCFQSRLPTRPPARWISLVLLLANLQGHSNPTNTRLPAAADLFVQRVWTKEHGLPSSTINDIVQTRDGYVWVATPLGISRFDGARFVTFNSANTTALVHEHITALAEDMDGNLWIGTLNGLVRLRQGKWDRFTTTNGLWDNHVRNLLRCRSGGVWVICAEHDAQIPDPSTDEIIHAEGRWRLCHVKEDGVIRHSLFDPDAREWRIQSLAESSNETLWLATQRGMWTLDPVTTLPTRLLHLRPPPPMFNDGWTGVGQAADGRMLGYFIGPWRYYHDSLVQFEPNGLFTGILRLDPSDGANRSRFILADRAGRTWIGAGKQGIDCLENDRIRRFTRADGLSQDWVLSAYVDRSGAVWLGTESGGLNRWEPRRVRVLGMNADLSSTNVQSVLPAADGSLWLGTREGLYRLPTGWVRQGIPVSIHAASLPQASIPPHPPWRDGSDPAQVPQGKPPRLWKQETGLSRADVRCLLEDRPGRIWIGTVAGLDCFEGDTIRRVPLVAPATESRVEALLCVGSPSRQLWIGTSRGLLFCDPDAPAETMALQDEQLQVQALAQGTDQNLWIGAADGLFRLTLGTGPTNQGPIEPVLTGVAINTLMFDPRGVLWVGGPDGLRRVSTDSHPIRVTPVPLGRAAADRSIYSILVDTSGWIWLVGQHTVSRARLTDVERAMSDPAHRAEWIILDHADGLPHGRIRDVRSQSIAWHAPGGGLWIGTTEGLALIDPASLELPSAQPRASLESVRLDGITAFDSGPSESSNPSSAAATMTVGKPTARPQIRHLRIAPGEARHVELQYTVPEFRAQHRLQFRYRLGGYEADWIPAGNRRVAVYSNLRPGTYEFQVGVDLGSSQSGSADTLLALELLPAFYQTRAAQILGLGVVLGAGAIGVNWRRRRLIRAERNRIARDLHDHLGTDLTLLRIEAESRGSDRPHPGDAGPTLAALASQASARLEEVIWTTDARRDDVHGLICYIVRFATEAFPPQGCPRLHLELPPSVPRWSIGPSRRHAVFLAVKETLHNAARHSQATEIHLKAWCTGGALQLTVADNGRGFAPSSIATVGDGFLNIRERIEGVGGTVQIEVAPGSGVRVAITVPIGPWRFLHKLKRRTGG